MFLTKIRNQVIAAKTTRCYHLFDNRKFLYTKQTIVLLSLAQLVKTMQGQILVTYSTSIKL